MTARSRAIEAILTGGLIAGLLDGLDAVVFYGWYARVSPARIFQGIASGLLGRSAFGGGAFTVILGILLHLTIAVGAAAFFYGAAGLMPLLWKKASLCGPAFGIGVFLFMQRIVLPLSAVAHRRSPMPPVELADQLFSHIFFVGLPIALATLSARKPEHADVITPNSVERTAPRFGRPDLRREP